MSDLLRKAVLFLLKQQEWNNRGGSLAAKCDCCGNYHWEGHCKTCRLGNLIKELEGAGKADNQELPKAQETGD